MYCLGIQGYGNVSRKKEWLSIWITFFDRWSVRWEVKGDLWNIGPHGRLWTILRSRFYGIIGIKSIIGMGSRESREELNTDSIVYSMGSRKME